MRRTLATSLAFLLAAMATDARSQPGTASESDNPDVPACLRAYEQAQVLRREGKLRSARAELILCVKDSCPVVARRDCTTWLDQVESSLPSLGISVVDHKGSPVLDAAVSLDGVPIPDWANGRAVGVDPGSHELRATRRGGETAVATVLVVEGRRNQQVVLELRPAGASDSPSPARASASEPESGSPAPWIFGGVAVLGFGGFAGFGIAALVRESDLDEGCAPGCTPDEIDSVRTLRVVSGISLGVGVVGAAGMMLALLLADDDPPPRSGRATKRAAAVAPWGDGQVTGVRARF